jgi:hypothetical protein
MALPYKQSLTKVSINALTPHPFRHATCAGFARKIAAESPLPKGRGDLMQRALSLAEFQRPRCLATLDRMWVEDGYFAREPYQPEVRFAFTNYGVSVGLQAVGAMPDRVQALNAYFDSYRSGDEYDHAAITHVMACSSHFPGLLLRQET